MIAVRRLQQRRWHMAAKCLRLQMHSRSVPRPLSVMMTPPPTRTQGSHKTRVSSRKQQKPPRLRRGPRRMLMMATTAGACSQCHAELPHIATRGVVVDGFCGGADTVNLPKMNDPSLYKLLGYAWTQLTAVIALLRRGLAAAQRPAGEVLDAEVLREQTKAAAAAAAAASIDNAAAAAAAVEESATQRAAREAFLAAQRSAARADQQRIPSEAETPPTRPDTPLSVQYASGASGGGCSLCGVILMLTSTQPSPWLAHWCLNTEADTGR